MKNKGLILLAGFILICFIAIGTYNWYLFFLKASDSYGNSSANTNAGSLTFSDYGNSVYETDADKLEEDEINQVTPYIFQVKNTKTKNENYQILIEDVPINTINDGCTSETLLTRDQLKYQLKLDGKVIKEEMLSNVKDNILDSQSILAGTTNKYELRIFIDENATDWTGKHFHYKVTFKEGK